MLNYEPDYAVHPGVILKDFMQTLNLKQTDLAISAGINRCMLNEIINGKRPITVSTARRLEKDFGLPATFWLNLQANYDARIESSETDKTYMKGLPNEKDGDTKLNKSPATKLLVAFNSLPTEHQQKVIKYAEDLLSECS
ncbi:MAG TPA: HigA family addiction module antitoxin [Clostridia bacterium]|jgi:addiction module HigA family antidote|nr:HigA family addiction module antitoxin [Clostridia bacterium]